MRCLLTMNASVCMLQLIMWLTVSVCVVLVLVLSVNSAVNFTARHFMFHCFYNDTG